ncbi:hypothetical protein [Oleomonas cavernae]|uniref:hypothetical protein n=1 Tax=Oleomonas cavernae TaxID=2320859 RepID=UPI001F367970|nr:hypothetical protein [Oleomonas cavernae]
MTQAAHAIAAPARPADLSERRLTGPLLAVLGGLSALASLATNIMLPSLPGIAGSFGVTTRRWASS